MSIFVRNNGHRMRYCRKWLPMACLCLLAMTACEEKDAKLASQKALLKAMELLEEGEMDKYYEYLDFGQELDSLTQAQIAKMWVMHQQINANAKGKAIATKVVKVDLLADSVAVVYYKIKYESGNEEVSANKMVRKDGKWRIRVRN